MQWSPWVGSSGSHRPHWSVDRCSHRRCLLAPELSVEVRSAPPSRSGTTTLRCPEHVARRGRHEGVEGGPCHNVCKATDRTGMNAAGLRKDVTEDLHRTTSLDMHEAAAPATAAQVGGAYLERQGTRRPENRRQGRTRECCRPAHKPSKPIMKHRTRYSGPTKPATGPASWATGRDAASQDIPNGH